MNQAVSASNKPGNFWWGLGVNVESQALVMGDNLVMARMFSSLDTSTSCVIRVSGIQFGPGLGGGGDIVLAMATGISAQSDFSTVRVDGGWSFSLRRGVGSSFSLKTFKGLRSAAQLVHLIKTVPTREILDVFVKKPAYVGKLKESVVAFYHTTTDGKDAATGGMDVAMHLPRLSIFPIAGLGFELGMTYQHFNPTELVSF
jgi:hypothetical protein